MANKYFILFRERDLEETIYAEADSVDDVLHHIALVSLGDHQIAGAANWDVEVHDLGPDGEKPVGTLAEDDEILDAIATM